jgi:hypothetical protein
MLLLPPPPHVSSFMCLKFNRIEWAAMFRTGAGVYDARAHVRFKTAEEAVRAGIVSENSIWAVTDKVRHPAATNGYWRRSLFTRYIDGWHPQHSHGICMMHELANFGEHLVNTMANQGNGYFSPTALAAETARRLPAWQKRDKYGVREEWQLSKEDMVLWDQRCSSLRLPTHDSKFPQLIDRKGPVKLKSSHWMTFLGPLGMWLVISSPSLSTHVKDAYCDAMWWCWWAMTKHIYRDCLPTYEEEGHHAFAQLELLLPQRSATLARHYLQHCYHYIRHLGPLHTSWMFSTERFNKTLGDMVHSYKNPSVNLETSLLTHTPLRSFGWFVVLGTRCLFPKPNVFER